MSGALPDKKWQLQTHREIPVPCLPPTFLSLNMINIFLKLALYIIVKLHKTRSKEEIFFKNSDQYLSSTGMQNRHAEIYEMHIQ